MNRIQEFKKPAEVKEAASKVVSVQLCPFVTHSKVDGTSGSAAVECSQRLKHGMEVTKGLLISNLPGQDWNAVLDEKESATTYDSKTDAYEYEQASGTITEKEAKKLRKQIRDLKRQKKVSEGDTKQTIKVSTFHDTFFV